MNVRTMVIIGIVLAVVAAIAPQAIVAAEPAAPTGAHAESESIGTPPLDWKTDLALWTLVIFVLLLLVLWKFAWGPISQGLLKREQHISNEIAEAERHRQEAHRLLAQYEAKLAASQEEVRAILDAARRDAQQAGQEILEKTKAEALAQQQRAVHEIETATAAALQEVAQRGATLAVDLAGKILRKRLDPGQDAQLIQEAMAGFAARGPSKN
jgi:F-type H+-transporting ATPase subunit b